MNRMARRRTEANVSRTNSEDTTPTWPRTMPAVTDLSALGWTRRPRRPSCPPAARPARVSRVDRGRLTRAHRRRREPRAPRRGPLRRVAACPARRSATGSRCAASWRSPSSRGRSAFVRTVAGRTSAAQVVAANLDTVLVVDALAGEARLRRVERYLAVAWSSGATPVVVLTKADLCDDVAAGGRAGRARTPSASRCCAVSSVTGEGLDAVRALLPPGRTGGDGRPVRRREVQPGERAGRRRRSPRPATSGRATAAAGTRRPRASCTCCPAAGCWSTPPACGSSRSTTTPRASTPPTPTSPRWPPTAGSATASTAPSPAARSPPPSTTAGSTPPATARWRKLQAEAHRQLLRVDARARAAEKARLRVLPPGAQGPAQPAAVTGRR